MATVVTKKETCPAEEDRFGHPFHTEPGGHPGPSAAGSQSGDPKAESQPSQPRGGVYGTCRIQPE